MAVEFDLFEVQLIKIMTQPLIRTRLMNWDNGVVMAMGTTSSSISGRMWTARTSQKWVNFLGCKIGYYFLIGSDELVKVSQEEFEEECIKR